MATKKKKATKKAAPKGALVCPDCGAPIKVRVNDGDPVVMMEKGPDCDVRKVDVRSLAPVDCKCGYRPAVGLHVSTRTTKWELR